MQLDTELKKERKEATLYVLETSINQITYVKNQVTSGSFELEENYKRGYLDALGRVLEFLDHLHNTANKI